jgi:hypothetical protein
VEKLYVIDPKSAKNVQPVAIKAQIIAKLKLWFSCQECDYENNVGHNASHVSALNILAPG